VNTRRGLRIVGRRGHQEVRDALVRFAPFLRLRFAFPIRVPAYLSSRHWLRTIEGEIASASFFAPFDLTVEPYIRIATGLYESEKAEIGRDNALAGYLCSLAHEVLHYQQWIKTGTTWEHGVPETAEALVDEYALTTDHP